MRIKYIPVSLLSAFCGRHKYKSQSTAIVELLQQYYTDDWNRMKKSAIADVEVYKSNLAVIEESFDVKINPNKTFQANYEKLISFPAVKEFVDQTPVAKIKLSERKTKKDVERQVREEIKETKDYKQAVKEMDSEKIQSKSPVVDKIVSMDRGTALEKTTIDLLRGQGVVIKKTSVPVQRWFTVGGKVTGWKEKPLKTPGLFMISGFIDAVNETTIYEIKNRKNTFFIPQYDLDQLITYIILHPERLSGSLVQQYNGEIKIDPTLSWSVAKEFWKEIKVDLDKAIGYVNSLLENEKEMRDFIMANTD